MKGRLLTNNLFYYFRQSYLSNATTTIKTNTTSQPHPPPLASSLRRFDYSRAASHNIRFDESFPLRSFPPIFLRSHLNLGPCGHGHGHQSTVFMCKSLSTHVTTTLPWAALNPHNMKKTSVSPSVWEADAVSTNPSVSTADPRKKG